MSHLPPVALHRWRPREALSAATLNANTDALLGLIEVAMATALTPDEAMVGLEPRIGLAEARLGRIEAMLAMHARQRNEREWAPMSHLGAVLQRVMDLQRTVEEATSRLLDAHAELRGAHASLGRRLARLEQRPEAASQEDHDALFKEHRRIAEKEHMLLAQVIALRHEVGVVTKLAMGHDRQANRLEYAPLASIGHLLQRIQEIEKRQNEGDQEKWQKGLNG